MSAIRQIQEAEQTPILERRALEPAHRRALGELVLLSAVTLIVLAWTTAIALGVVTLVHHI